MRNYNYDEKWQALLVPDVIALLTKIHEFKGQQKFFIQSKKDQISHLIDLAKIQSTEASNRIEGVYTSDDRLKKLILDKTMPKTRDEQEIAGYRDVLATIHESYNYIPINSTHILQLHQSLYRFSGMTFGGKYKIANNTITEKDSQGNERIRFEPVQAWETQQAVNELCQALDNAMKNPIIDPLLLLPMFILDFLCIHPFSDGNGRMSRLLTLLLLYKSGYVVGKYISLEHLIEKSKETYYETLYQSSLNWHEEKNNYEPFVKYILGIIVAAYRDFTSRVELLIAQKLSKQERVAQTIKETFGKITKSDIAKQCPDISTITIQRALKELTKKGDIIQIGTGRYTSYIYNREK